MRHIRIDPENVEREAVSEVSGMLMEGRVGVIPTDTVYGACALASSGEAVSRLHRIKERPRGKPFPLLVASLKEAGRMVEVSRDARRLIDAFWPGPLTVVMRRLPGVALPVQEGESLGLRMPASRFCLALIERAGPIVAPSANLAGAPPPVSFDDVAEEFLERVDFAVDAGRCPRGVESTVVDATGNFTVLREGALPEQEVERALHGNAPGQRQFRILFLCTGNICRSPMAQGFAEARLSRYPGHSGRVTAGSAGIAALDGSPASREAVEVMSRRGVDISGHVARTVSLGMLDSCDLVLAMERRQVEEVRALVPRARAFLLLELGEAARLSRRTAAGLRAKDPHCMLERLEGELRGREGAPRRGELEVPDPIGMPVSEYEKVADLMERSVEDVLAYLLGGP